MFRFCKKKMLKILAIALLVVIAVTTSNAFDDTDLDFKPLSKDSLIAKRLTDFVLGHMRRKLTLGRSRCRDVGIELRQVVDVEKAIDDDGFYYRIEISTRVVSAQCKFAYSRSPCVASVFLPKIGKKLFQLKGLDCAVE